MTPGSLLLVSILIGILATGIQGRIERLRRGRSTVVESGHTVILGWSEQVLTVVSELVIANQNQRHSCIVILGDKDKVEMEDDFRQKVGAAGHTRIVCRSGNPIEAEDIDITSPQTAKSIIVVSPEGDRPDAQVVKTAAVGSATVADGVVINARKSEEIVFSDQDRIVVLRES